MLNTSSVHTFTPYFSRRFIIVLVALKVRRGRVVPVAFGRGILKGDLVELHHLIEDNRRIRVVTVVVLDLPRTAGIVDKLTVPVVHLVGVIQALVRG